MSRQLLQTKIVLLKLVIGKDVAVSANKESMNKSSSENLFPQCTGLSLIKSQVWQSEGYQQRL